MIFRKKVLTFGLRFGILLKLSVTHDAAEKNLFKKEKFGLDNVDDRLYNSNVPPPRRQGVYLVN